MLIDFNKPRYIAIVIFAFYTVHYSQQHDIIRGGMLTANDYFDLSNSERLYYVMGLADMMYMRQGIPGKHKLKDTWFFTLLFGMENRQIKKMFDKYLEKNAALWHRPANILFYMAMLVEYEKTYGIDPNTGEPPEEKK